MKALNFNFKAESNGSISFSNERSAISVHPDGTIAISSKDPVQLTGACLAKLDNSTVSAEDRSNIFALLLKRL